MQVEEYNDSYQDDVITWFVGHGWDQPSHELLSPTGLIVPGLACGWVYDVEGKFSFIGWPVTNPQASHSGRIKALGLVIDGLTDIARDRGSRLIFAWAKHSSLLKLYERVGFFVGDQGSTNFIKDL